MKTKVNEKSNMYIILSDINDELDKYKAPTIDIMEVNELVLPAEVFLAAVGAAAAVVGAHIANKMMG